MMVREKKQRPIVLIVLLALSLAITACAPSAAEKLNKEGNDAFTKQAFQEALVAYQRAQIEEPELAEPYYNAANALYRQGAYDAALEQLQQALSFADQEALAQAGYYNQGNTAYNQQDLETAVASYTQSLLINPDDQDAKYNLELALQQQQQNEEQQQEDQSQEGESQEDQQQDQNGEQQDESEQNQGEDQSEQNSGQEEEQQAETQERQESDQGQEGSSPEEEQQDQGQQDEQQQEEQQQQGQGQPQDGQPDGNQEGQLNELPAPGQRMTEEQAKQLLAAIARDGQTLQEKLGQIFAVPWVPPVQDW